MIAVVVGAVVPDAGILARALTAAAPVAVMAAWALVRGGRTSVWTAMAAVLGSLGIASLLTGQVRAGEQPPAWVGVLLGVGAGVALYLATAVFLSLARGWRTLGRHAAELYTRRGDLSVTAAVVVAAGISAGGEELLWRGVVLGVAVGAFGDVAGAVLAWGLYVVANTVSGSVAILLAAVVGGAVWTALALWTGGVAASVACHAVWTALMIALPPLPSEERA